MSVPVLGSSWHCTQKPPLLEPFKHVEHCLDADTSFPNLLPKGVRKVVAFCGQDFAELFIQDALDFGG
ncbi:hypothetical protein N658DRAFT_511673 [Parathielavia hyrcaniae]|uniref:Uncharacterized protein n=1 Tax=Parathielavia hyrcaniae TaxID=113614 RepID=A0AAN6SWY9_9PEZI|nr:hypothetical protein N658DRAFT_511673 [Parathielavia hyrcaniae]